MIDKKQIIEKSAQLFKSSGIRTNTMDDIASAVGISKKTLYQWVSDKNELITEVINQEYTETQSTLEKICLESANSIDELIRINAFIINFLKSINPVAISDIKKLYQNIYIDSKSRFKDIFSQSIKRSISEGKKSNVFRKDINEELITELHTDRIDKLQEVSSFWSSLADSTHTKQELITYYIRGLVTKQGETILNKYIADFNKYLKE